MSDADSFNNDEYTYQNNINPVEMNGEAENEEYAVENPYEYASDGFDEKSYAENSYYASLDQQEDFDRHENHTIGSIIKTVAWLQVASLIIAFIPLIGAFVSTGCEIGIIVCYFRLKKFSKDVNKAFIFWLVKFGLDIIGIVLSIITAVGMMFMGADAETLILAIASFTSIAPAVAGLLSSYFLYGGFAEFAGRVNYELADKWLRFRTWFLVVDIIGIILTFINVFTSDFTGSLLGGIVGLAALVLAIIQMVYTFKTADELEVA